MMNEEDDLCIVLPNGCHITNDLLRLHLPLGGGPPLHPLILFIIIFLHFICPPTITLNSAHTKLTVRIYLYSVLSLLLLPWAWMSNPAS